MPLPEPASTLKDGAVRVRGMNAEILVCTVVDGRRSLLQALFCLVLSGGEEDRLAGS